MEKNGENRYLLIDGLRGLAIVNMVMFHFLYDVYVVSGRNPGWYFFPGIRIWQQAICHTFILVAGFVWRFGKENSLRRGLFFHLCGALVSLVTGAVIPREAVRFGILSFMGSSVLLMIPLHKCFRRIPAWTGFSASLACFVLLRKVEYGVVGVGGQVFWKVPRALYQIRILAPFGFPSPDFSSSDYFPILPWVFLFLAGYFLYPLLERREAWRQIAGRRIPLLSVVGQKSIWIYLIHQPVCMGVWMAIRWLKGS